LLREVGGDGGRTTGGLRMRFAGLCWTSFRQSWDWWREEGVGARTAGDLANRMLCALEQAYKIVLIAKSMDSSYSVFSRAFTGLLAGKLCFIPQAIYESRGHAQT
jgi:hypothetical protein